MSACALFHGPAGDLKSLSTRPNSAIMSLQAPIVQQISSITGADLVKTSGVCSVNRDMLDPGAPLCSEKERGALTVLWSKLATISHKDSFFLPREVAFAIASTVEIRQKRFSQAGDDAKVCSFKSVDSDVIVKLVFFIPMSVMQVSRNTLS